MKYVKAVQLYALTMILPATLFFSCHKAEEEVTKPAVAIGAADSIKAFPGINSMVLSWEVKDPTIVRAVAHCDNGDSISARYDGSGTMQVRFTELQDGNYSFSIYLYDSQGRSSARAKLVARVYGDRYIASLTSRTFRDAIYDHNSVIISWDKPSSGMLGTEVRYLDASGDTQHLYIQPDRDSAVLSNFKPGSHFEYRTMYKPAAEAIDTFYAAYSSSDKSSTFSNPLFLEKGADPWITYHDGMYYFTYTTGGSVVIYATRKVSELAHASPVTIWRPPTGTDHSKEIWAPELHFINQKWYVYFAADDGQDMNHRMYVLQNASSDPLQGTWEFKGELQEPADDWAIDGTVLENGGQLYMIWSGKTNGGFPQNLYIAKLSDPLTLEGSRVMISTPEYNWEEHGAPINEGPEILKNHDGRVFLIYSASGYWTDDYCLGMLSLAPGGDPLNPADWTKHAGPVFKQDADAGAYGTGHCSFFSSRDGTEDWILYHARSFPDGGSTNHRNPRMQQFTWNADGTPEFGTPVKISQPLRTPSGEF